MAVKPTPDQSYLIEKFSYSPETGLLVRKKSAGKHKSGALAGYKNHRGYQKVCINGSHFFAHRIIWKIVYGYDPNGEIDHINRNRLDNRLSNLRDVSSEENQLNKATPRGSDFVGVYFNKSKQKWQARIQLHLGWFDTPQNAASAREAALKSIGV